MNFVRTISLSNGVETIFSKGSNIFIGTQMGMFIYEMSSDGNLSYVSEYEHVVSCDPVVADADYAYVTLRSGTWCEGFTNQLDLIDITDLTNPVLEKTFNMDNPHGLSIKGDNLYLCEGEFGLKTFDISDPMKLNRNKIDI